MAERLKFKCHNCPETYSLLREITEGKRILLVKCPFCGAEAQVDLKPYESKAEPIFRSDDAPASRGKVLNLPEILPTEPRT
jgi:uncharacterized Zn finger protein